MSEQDERKRLYELNKKRLSDKGLETYEEEKEFIELDKKYPNLSTPYHQGD